MADRSSPLAVYVPGASVVHRLPAGAKLLALVAAGAAVLAIASPLAAGIAVATALLGFALARLSLRYAWRGVRPTWIFLIGIFAFQWWSADLSRAVGVVGSIVALLLAATLVSLTTRTSDMIDAIVWLLRPLRRVGVDPDRIALQLALGVRAVPLIAELAETARQAQYARGRRASPRAFAVPLVVRALRRADAMSDALRARGLDD
ncbi:energy-coupling factor transporter transmembrane component T family protein [Pseudoclavibacter terrae]|uniref:Energy-coupling factor transporter transmembrane protein EcfT n=1 Tax=Pseudoclavibacter terrae TaxID=1530195 RepID=A0A7J5B5K3_9MICO|nr:energy-coupling factor transporter transmembrane protein EcfT [Pseudoclavibacter terrae]KAB1638991.1 energy-coupling factor transporter transmembrane protein EcfT [Pseudoclavibacter terrae]